MVICENWKSRKKCCCAPTWSSFVSILTRLLRVVGGILLTGSKENSIFLVAYASYKKPGKVEARTAGSHMLRSPASARAETETSLTTKNNLSAGLTCCSLRELHGKNGTLAELVTN